MSLNLPTIPQQKIELARFSTPHGPLELPTDPSLIVWHVSTSPDTDGNLTFAISGSPLSFDADPSAQAFSSLEDCIAYVQSAAPSPAPGISTLTSLKTSARDRAYSHLSCRTHDPLLTTRASAITPSEATALRQYLLDTGPIRYDSIYELRSLASRYPSYFYTKSAKDQLLAARPLKSKKKAPKPTPSTPDSPTPPVSAPVLLTPLQIHASLRHLPAVNHDEREARRTWLLHRGCIPIPYHRAFFNTFKPLLMPTLTGEGSRYGGTSYDRPHPISLRNSYFDNPTPRDTRPTTVLYTCGDGYPNYYSPFHRTSELNCRQSSPDYSEELSFFLSLNSAVIKFLETLFDPDLRFTACPTYRPHLRTPRFPNPFLHFLFRYRRLAVRSALSYYQPYLSHLLRPVPKDDRVGTNDSQAYTERNRKMVCLLLSLQRAMELRAFPDQFSCATHLSTEELDSL